MIAFELVTLAWIRWRFFATGFLRSFVSIALGGVIIASISAGLGQSADPANPLSRKDENHGHPSPLGRRQTVDRAADPDLRDPASWTRSSYLRLATCSWPT